MARHRSYRRDLRCPRCGSNWMPKDGRSHGNQTYRCGDCNCRYTPDGNRHCYPEKTVRQALNCCKDGMSVSAIARAMEINCAAMYGWVKKAQEAMTVMGMERERRNPSAADIPDLVKAMRGIDAERAEASVISFDEMRSYVGVRNGENRRSARVWTAADSESERGYETRIHRHSRQRKPELRRRET